MSTVYDTRSLATAYIEANSSHYHQDLKDDAISFLRALEKAFGIDLEERDTTLKMVAMNFRLPALVRNCGRMLYTTSGMLEDGITPNQINRAGERGKNIEAIESSINKKIGQVQVEVLELISQYLCLMWPIEGNTVSSKDLLALGFDDSKRPTERDYGFD